MEVNFNGLRRNLVDSYNELVDTLQRSGRIEQPCGVEYVKIEPDELAAELDSLRRDILMVSAIELPDVFPSIIDDDFKLKTFEVDNENDDDA